MTFFIYAGEILAGECIIRTLGTLITFTKADTPLECKATFEKWWRYVDVYVDVYLHISTISLSYIYIYIICLFVCLFNGSGE